MGGQTGNRVGGPALRMVVRCVACVRVHEWVGEWANERAGERANKRAGEQANKQAGEWENKWASERENERYHAS